MVKAKTFLPIPIILALFFLGCTTRSKIGPPDELNDNFLIKQWDKAPEVVYDAKPRYPVKAAKQGIQGQAIVAVTVAQDGSVMNVELNTSTGDKTLDISAIEAAKRFKFRPAIKDGKAIQSTVTLPVAFKIR